jgi:hypothetical protein
LSPAISIGKTLLLVFISAVLGQLVAYGAGIFDLSAGEWKGVAAAGIAAAIAFAYNFIGPDSRYGVSWDK